MTKNLFVAPALAAMLAALSAVAQTSGDPAAGREMARQVCAACHKVTIAQTAPSRSAPSFAAIANMSSTTETALHAFLSTPHANMPNLMLKQQQQDDVIAYILGLRRPQ
ncbi:MAG TPA: c-type cytochrome [Stellaceae bacterium]|jgi:mono/diheme cytochrome c family protein|nr:c-type cytochrome [Stellaceae bacterium]